MAEKLLNFHNVEHTQSKFPIRLPRSVVLQASFFSFSSEVLLTHNAYPYNGTRKVVIWNDYMKDGLSGCVKNDLNLDLQLMPLVWRSVHLLQK